MPAPRPDSDRDLRLARRLDAGEAPDGTDALHDALRAARPEAPPLETGASERLWAGIASQMDRPARPAAQDRAPLRLAPKRHVRTVRWTAAALVLLAAGAGLWTLQQDRDVVAGAAAVTWQAPDGSTVTLRPHSRLVRLGARAYRLDGEALFAVAHDPAHPFTVAADVATVRVLGTRFDVSTWGAQTDVFVAEGRVEVRGVASAVMLTAGQAATARAGAVARVAAPDADAALDWTRGEAVFERETVRRVADEVAQHFGVRVAVPPDVGRLTVSGVLRLDGAAAALDGLGRILGGRFVADGADGFRFVAP